MSIEDKDYTRYVRDIYDLNLLIESSIDRAKIALKTKDYRYANVQLSYAKAYIEDILERPFRENEK
jgi:hypothetical protein